MAEDEALHPIFSQDPEEWMSFIYKQASILMEDGTEHVGWVYTIDPVTECYVLVSFEDEKTEVKVLMGPSIRSVAIINENTETHRARLDSMFRPEEVLSFSEEEIEKRKLLLKSWLTKNRLPVQITGNNNEILSISDALFIEPPYGPGNCRSTNEIILGRIQGLIKNMPPDQGEW